MKPQHPSRFCSNLDNNVPLYSNVVCIALPSLSAGNKHCKYRQKMMQNAIKHPSDLGNRLQLHQLPSTIQLDSKEALWARDQRVSFHAASIFRSSGFNPHRLHSSRRNHLPPECATEDSSTLGSLAVSWKGVVDWNHTKSPKGDVYRLYRCI